MSIIAEIMQGLLGQDGAGSSMFNMAQGNQGDESMASPQAPADYLTLHAQNEARMRAAEESRTRQIMDRLVSLGRQSKSDDVFISGGPGFDKSEYADKGYASNNPPAQSRGSFSRSNAPIAEQAAIRDLVAQGMSETQAAGIVGAPPEIRAIRLEQIKQSQSANAPIGKRELMELIGKSKDPQGTLAAILKLVESGKF